MQIIQLSTRAKQALFALFFFIVIVGTFFATKAWAMESNPKAPLEIRSEPYDEYVRPRPAITTTSTTTTTQPKAVKPIPKPQTTEAAPVVVPSGDVWEALRNCEAGGNYSTNTGNGYYGAYQFSAPTWRSMGTAYEYAHLAPPEVQDDAAKRLQARSGWGQWPACSKKIGVR